MPVSQNTLTMSEKIIDVDQAQQLLQAQFTTNSLISTSSQTDGSGSQVMIPWTPEEDSTLQVRIRNKQQNKTKIH
jgi:hypothetical protein